MDMHRPAEPEAALAAAPAPSPPSRRRTLAARAGKAIVVLLVGYYVVAVALLVVYRFVEPPITGVQLQRRVEARIAGRDYRVERRILPYAALPAHVGRAVVAAEDGSFWTHWGFDFEEMRVAGARLLEG
ncbi:hypothetical protein BH23GEM2_BH23GEM2_05620 [soil metagenome]